MSRLVGVMLGLAAGCGGTSGASGDSLGSYLAGLAAQGELTGAVRIEQAGQVLVDHAYGLADEAAQVANTPATRFRIGSNTKQMTAMAILLLADDGLLTTGDPICRYLTPCPDAWAPITIQQLLDHSSGIPDYINSPDFPTYITTPATVDDLIARFRDLPLDFPPGTVWSYSNSGYLLLGAIITRVSGLAYADFLQQRIFTPLGMADTAYDTDVPPPGTPPGAHATGYLSPGVEPVLLALSEFDAAGAIASTTADLSRWDHALLDGTIGSAAARAAMFSPQIACPHPAGCAMASDIGYGDGWFLAGPTDHRYIYHWGRIDGFQSSNGFYADDGTIVIMLSNLETTSTFTISTHLGNLARGVPGI